MAKCRDVISSCAQISWILLLMLAQSIGKKNKILYMDGPDCGSTLQLGGAIVYSHYRSESAYYSKNIECRITFKAPHDEWRLMLRVEELDVPDKSFNELCNDAVYVYDGSTIITHAVKQAGGIGGFCGSKFSHLIYSTGQFLTIYFRTDSSGPAGRGFRLVITAFSDDHEKYSSCGSQFQCSSNKCIDPDLTCDNIDHCADFSDESARADCGGFGSGILSSSNGNSTGHGFLEKFLSLGVTAAISITVGTVVVFIVCIVCVICCCCRCMRKQPQDSPLGGPTTATATSVTINNGGPPLHYHQAPSWHVTTAHHTPSYRGTSYEDLRAYSHSHAGSSLYSHSHHSPAAPLQYHSPQSYIPAHHNPHGHGQPVGHHPQIQGYYPMQQVQPGHQVQGLTYSPYPQQRESYSHSHSQGSGYSSQPPPSYHRSYTPTSSRSGRSVRSNESSIVKYEKDKLVTLPVNL